MSGNILAEEAVKSDVVEMLEVPVQNLSQTEPSPQGKKPLDSGELRIEVSQEREALVRRADVARKALEAELTKDKPPQLVGDLRRNTEDYYLKVQNSLPNLIVPDDPVSNKTRRSINRAVQRTKYLVEQLEGLLDTVGNAMKKQRDRLDEQISSQKKARDNRIDEIKSENRYGKLQETVDTPIRDNSNRVVGQINERILTFYRQKVVETTPKGKKAKEDPNHAKYKVLVGHLEEYLKAEEKLKEVNASIQLIESQSAESIKPLEEQKGQYKRSQLIEWNPPPDIVYGTPLNETQLNAVRVTGHGEIKYTSNRADANGKVLPVGVHTLQATLEETDEFVGTSRDVTITVTPAPMEIVCGQSSVNMIFGTKFSNDEMGVSVRTTEQTKSSDTDLAKELVFSSKGTEITNGQLLAAGSYDLVIKSKPLQNFVAPKENTIQLVVQKASATIEWAPGVESLTYGTRLTASHLSATVNSNSPSAGENEKLANMIKYYTAAREEVKEGHLLGVGSHAVTAEIPEIANFETIAARSWSVKVTKATQTIQWPAPAEMTYGTPLSGSQLNATVSTNCTLPINQRKLTTIQYFNDQQVEVKPGDYLTAGTHTIIAKGKAPNGDEQFEKAEDKSVDIQVKKARLTLKTKSPEPIESPVSKADMAQLRRKMNFSAGPDQLQFWIGLTELKVGAKPPLGKNQTLKVVAPTSKNYEDIAPVQMSLDVSRQMPVIEWSEPKPLISNSALSATQLCAKVKNGDGTLTYAPAKGQVLSCAGGEPENHFLTATHPETENFALATKTVRLTVVASQAHKNGYEKMRDGSDFDQSNLNSKQAKLVSQWDNDEGGVKTETVELLNKLKELPGKELEKLMDELVTDPSMKVDQRDRSYPPAYPNVIWALPNGIQVRYKPAGDDFIPSEMFCIEGRVSEGCSGSAEDVAFKVSVDGAAAARGPAHNQYIQANGTTVANTRKGSCYATHIQCAPTRKPTVQWNVPVKLTYGMKFSQEWLVVPRDCGEVTWQDPSDMGAFLKVGEQTAKVEIAKTDKYEACTAEKMFQVGKAKQKIECVSQVDLIEGATISLDDLKAKIAVEPSEAATVEADILVNLQKALKLVNNQEVSVEGTELPVKEGHPLRVVADATAHFEAAAQTVTVNVKAKPKAESNED